MSLGCLFVQEPLVERITATPTMHMERRAIRSVPFSKIITYFIEINVRLQECIH